MQIDIEGYEFELLRHLLLRRTAALCQLQVAAVEWSMYQMPRDVAYFSNERMDLRKWMTEKPCGVTFRRWV